MLSNVLILSTREDNHALQVEQHLTKLGARTTFWRFEQLLNESKLTYQFDALNQSFEFSEQNGQIDFLGFDSIWFRRPGKIGAKQFFQPWISNIVEVESRHAILGMLYSLPCLWVNHPAKDITAGLKLFQLNLAKKLGLSMPETIITNEPEKARAFYDKHNGNIVYKLLTEVSNLSLPKYEFPHGIPTLPVRLSDLDHFGQVIHSPHLFQQRIKKQSDLRVTVIGQRIFGIKIDSQSGKGALDWRNDYSVPMSIWKVPDEVASKCLLLTQMLGLNFGAIDFCLDQDNEPVFLEINPAGQFLWIETRTELKLGLEMALLLGGKSAPLVSYEQAAFSVR